MKKLFTLLALTIVFSINGQVGINNENPDASAALDITSTTGGLLPPRMSEAERILIDAPVAGLIIWCSNCGTKGKLQVYNGTKWTHISSIAVPDAPTIGIATAQNEKATITFTAPTDNGDSTITTYTATSSPDGIIGTISQAGSGVIIVSGLTNDTAYTFTVSATNAIGTSVASAASNSVTPKTSSQEITEPFTNSAATSSYASSSFVGNGGVSWSYISSRNANNDYNESGISLPAIMFSGSLTSKITSSTITGGIGNFSVKLYKGFTGGGDRQVELFINGVSKGLSEAFDDYDEHTFIVSAINMTGEVIIELKNKTLKQVIVDDITWTQF